MKTTVLIQDGRMQLVLTPETTAETNMVEVFRDDNCGVRIDKANFSECSGGWLRNFKDVNSLMIQLLNVKDANPPARPSPSLSNIADGTWPGDEPPEPILGGDLLDKATHFFEELAAGVSADVGLFTEHEASWLAKWLAWHRGRTRG